MTFKIIRTPKAQRDLIEHYAFIARDKVDPADRFLRVVEEAGGIEVLTVLHGTRDLGLALRRVADERNPEKER